HYSEIEVELTPSSRSKAEIVAELRERLAVLPVAVNVGSPALLWRPPPPLERLLSGVRAESALKVFGDQLDRLVSVAEDLRQRLSKIPGLVDLQVEKKVGIPPLDIRIDYGP